MADSQASLLEQVRSGANRQLQMLAAEGLLPLPPEQLIPVQVSLTLGSDMEVAALAAESLKKVDARFAQSYLAREAGPEVLAFFAGYVTHPLVIETLLRRRDVPRPILADLARRLPADLQEILLLRQDAIVEAPEILEALEQNPDLSSYSQRRIDEYREHLLPRDRSVRPAEPAVEDEIDDFELAAEVEAARELPESGEVDVEKTKLSEGQIRTLSIPARLKLTRGAPRSLRAILIRDNNSLIAVSVITNNSLTDQEVEQTASNRAVVEEVLEAIARNRQWSAKYNVAKALVQNPRTYLPTALRLMTRLSVRDLRDLSRDRNVADAIRSTALRLYTIKQK
ncbi:MAG TPA: hypothetical protein VJ725_16710 [Thermoanaerobaculia bacterium]|nr:hypothetical protein [Thermoanaerobaculia bacterium]